MRLRFSLILASVVSLGCTSAGGESRRPLATNSVQPPAPAEAAPPRGVVDSALPLEEEIRRFRAEVPETPAHLMGGERSRNALVRRWVHSIETRDSAALRQMAMNPAEFITFYYPESPYVHPPYRQSPSLRWFLIISKSNQGITRVWQRHAGQPLGFTGYTCDADPELVGRNRIWTNCTVQLRTSAGERSIHLFGPIIEREGWFKFLSYQSDY